MKIKEVAKLLDCSELTVRVGLQKGVFPFGVAMKVTGQRYKYIIYPEKLKEFVGETK